MQRKREIVFEKGFRRRPPAAYMGSAAYEKALKTYRRRRKARLMRWCPIEWSGEMYVLRGLKTLYRVLRLTKDAGELGLTFKLMEHLLMFKAYVTEKGADSAALSMVMRYTQTVLWTYPTYLNMILRYEELQRKGYLIRVEKPSGHWALTMKSRTFIFDLEKRFKGDFDKGLSE